MRVKENDVLIAAARWLLGRNVLPYQFSVASGKGIDYSSEKARVINEVQKLYQKLKLYPELPHFCNDGPDILGIDPQSFLKVANEQEIDPENSEWWQIECKGIGGKPATQRDKFDRGLASVVSYFGASQEFGNVKPYLGFALPNTKHLKHHLQTRLRRPLRTHLNLWVLVYDPDDKSVQEVPPDAEYT